MFKHEVLNSVSSLCWWTSQDHFLHKETIDLITQLLTDVASSAGVERVFSTFVLVQSDLRSRLETQKASKLIFIYKMLNNKE